MKKVALVSRVDKPVTVTYDDKQFILAPRKKTKKEFKVDLLGPIDEKKVTILK